MVKRYEYQPTGAMGPYKSLLLSDFRIQVSAVSERNQCDDVRTHRRVAKKEEIAPPVAGVVP
jgi:hypothetical protein